MLQAKRYIVERRDIENVSEARLSDIEMQLFRSIQEINIEKGRRMARQLSPSAAVTTAGTTTNNTSGVSDRRSEMVVVGTATATSNLSQSSGQKKKAFPPVPVIRDVSQEALNELNRGDQVFPQTDCEDLESDYDRVNL